MRAIFHLTLSSCLLVGCFAQPTAPDREQAKISPETSACLERLSGTAFSSAHRLDNSGFSIVNWNVQKGKHENWAGDLQDLYLGADLLILQEAPGEFDEWDEIAPLHHRSFAEGFGLSRSVTGVLTMSSVEPLTECKLVALEPWFLTRKATLVTEYALTDTVETLLVVNIHSINFSFGVKHMRKQLSQAAAVIEHHDGPVLLSGDFNTWRGRRAEVVETLVKRLGLVALEYDVDHRKRWFGRALDHIYVRGLRALQATTMEVGSSDHNPMAVRFSYWPEHRGITAAP